ncbi:MAG: glycosyltransferase, partial [Anaerolineales bacterium]|nr:glycosyltransferase [Anaerolineales bacterium]
MGFQEDTGGQSMNGGNEVTMNIHFLSVIIPVLNEGSVIGSIIERIQNVLKTEAFQYEILVIDDGS